MRRRDFVSAIVGSATAWSLTARAQQSKPMRRVAALMPSSANDPQVQERNAAFLQGLQQFGWSVGHNLHIDYRWLGGGSEDDTRKYVAELVALAPDVILASGTAALAALRRATRTLPIVFVLIPDPVGAGFVDSLSRPGGNITGFTNFDYAIGAKWLELLKEIAPSTTHAAVLRDPTITAGLGLWAAIQSVSPTVAIEVSPISLVDPAEIDRALAIFAHNPNGGLIATGSALTVVHHDLIIALAARYRLPAVYYDRYFVEAGGLMSYGSNSVEEFRLAAAYVDRILNGEKPAELPVQTATKYETVINRKTAKALGLAIPPSLLARADEVIE